MNLAERLLDIAREPVADHPDFFQTKGPGTGDLATNAFMSDLHVRARQEFGDDYAEKKICGSIEEWSDV